MIRLKPSREEPDDIPPGRERARLGAGGRTVRAGTALQTRRPAPTRTTT